MWTAIVVAYIVGPVDAQQTGDVTQVDLVGGAATLMLDFSDQDYELILYSTITDVEDTTRRFNYTVSGPSVPAKPIVAAKRGEMSMPDERSTLFITLMDGIAFSSRGISTRSRASIKLDPVCLNTVKYTEMRPIIREMLTPIRSMPRL